MEKKSKHKFYFLNIESSEQSYTQTILIYDTTSTMLTPNRF